MNAPADPKRLVPKPRALHEFEERIGRGRLYDRLTDVPMLLLVGWASTDVLPPALVLAKLALDVTLLVLFAIRKRTTENRIGTTISDLTLFAMLFLSQGYLPTIVSAELVRALLWINVLFTGLVALANLDVLKKRYIADSLSFSNAACGVVSAYFATHLEGTVVGVAFERFRSVGRRGTNAEEETP